MSDMRIALNRSPQDHGAATVYWSGSEITGTLVLTVNEPKSYNYIKVYLEGKAYVRWTSGRTRYIGNLQILDSSVLLWTKQQAQPDGKIHPGQYNFPFRFVLPARLPRSYEGKYGWIRYTIGARIGTGLMKFDRVIESDITVIENVYITAAMHRPLRLEKQKTVGCLCCAAGSITTTVEIPRTGYCAGEDIPLKVTVENGSNRLIRVSAVLQEQPIFTVRGHYTTGTYVNHFTVSSPTISPGVTTVWAPEEGTLRLPATIATTLDVRMIKVEFLLKVSVIIPNALDSDFSIPVTIGNVPYSQQSSDLIPLILTTLRAAPTTSATDFTTGVEDDDQYGDATTPLLT